MGFLPIELLPSNPLLDLKSHPHKELLNEVYEYIFLWFPNFLTGIETLVLLS